ncbi:MAG: extracellular solute-binding protein [Burkholderiales bacterium]|nr:extracellular solute-binding protein [Burkholderiales bacterium]
MRGGGLGLCGHGLPGRRKRERSAIKNTVPFDCPRADSNIECPGRSIQVPAPVRSLIACLAALLAPVVFAQAPARNDDVLRYRGADRDARLVERARQEGTVVLYTSLAPTESKPLAEAFEKKYGVKVELWRALSDKVVQRVITEARANRHAVDVVETNGPEMEALAQERLLAEVHSPYLADLPADGIPPHRLWYPDRLNFFVVGYNTEKVQRSELPATYEGFLDPRWKGRIAIEATDSEWMAAVVKRWGEAKGMDFFRKLAAMKPDVRKGHVLLAQLVATGEVQVGLTMYNANIESLKKKGAPIDFVPVQPVIARPQGIGVAKEAPHPAAALLFVDFVLSPEGQRLYESMGRVPASTKVKSELNNFPFVMTDPNTILKESQKWEALWNELFLAK